MQKIVSLLKKRIKGKPKAYSGEIGIPASTLFSYINGQRQIGINRARSMIRYYKNIGDTEMVNALITYISGE